MRALSVQFVARHKVVVLVVGTEGVSTVWCAVQSGWSGRTVGTEGGRGRERERERDYERVRG
eukprot:1730840-Rhodomonas_salina.1